MTTVRWVLVDEDTTTAVTLAVNPNTMDPFPRDRALVSAYPSRNNQDRQRTFQQSTTPRTYTWGGSIRTQGQYETLRNLSRLAGVVEVTDHLGRVFRGVMVSFKPDRKPRAPGSYRMKYTIVIQWIGRVS